MGNTDGDLTAEKENDPDANPFLRMPAEWERQQAIWLAWPWNVETWVENLAQAQNEFIELALAISRDQTVFVCGHESTRDDFVKQLKTRGESNNANIQFKLVPTNDAWIRDYGPTFVRAAQPDRLQQQLDVAYESQTRIVLGTGDSNLVAIDWRYNAWGGKYPPFDRDQTVAGRIAEQMSLARIESPLVVEGGGLEINSAGVLFVTESCLLDVNRNNGTNLPEFAGRDNDSADPNYRADLKRQLTREFQILLGARHVIRLPGDWTDPSTGKISKTLIGDDTDGHVDQLARFVNDTTLVHAWTADASDPQHAPISKNSDALKHALAELDLSYQLIPLPIPKNPVMMGSLRIPASYCNFLITNASVIVPQFGDPNDQPAIQILQELFPARQVIGLPSKHLSVGLGSFHCLSQQMPE